MRRSHLLPGVLLALLVALAPACALPDGPPVYVDGRHGKLWSGKGILLEVDDEGTWCKVAVRNRALVVEERWVDCRSVHRRMGGT